MRFRAEDALGALQEALRAGPLRVRIDGDCMQPALAPGDTVEVRPTRFFLPGDIAVFVGQDARMTAHRVLGYRPGRPWTLLTQSDSAAVGDAAVPLSRVLGRAVLPRGGSVALGQRLGALRAYAARAVGAAARRLDRSR